MLEVPIDWEDGQAAPAIAHGGFLAALADHVMGFAAAQQELASFLGSLAT